MMGAPRLNPVELNRRMTTNLNKPPGGLSERRMTRDIQSDTEQLIAGDPNALGQPSGSNMGRRATRAVQFDPSQQNFVDPLAQGLPTTTNNLQRRMTKMNQEVQQNIGDPFTQDPSIAYNLNRRMTKMNQEMQQDIPVQGQPTADPMGRRGTRGVNMELMGMAQAAMPLDMMQPGMMQSGMRPSIMQPGPRPSMMQQGGRPSMVQSTRPSMMMQPHMQPWISNQMMDSYEHDGGMAHPMETNKKSKSKDDERLRTTLEHCREPTKFRCKNCNYTGLSKTEYEAGCYAFVTICVTMVYCAPFAYCACMLTKWKDALQYCPDCGKLINKVEPPDGTLPIVCCWDICELCAGDGEK